MTQNLSVEQFLAKKKPATRSVTLVLDQETATEWNSAQTEVASAKVEALGLNEPSTRIADAQKALEQLRPKIEKASVEFTFRSIGRNPFRALLEAHPPTEEQKAKAEGEGITDLDHDLDSFPPALVAASLVSPKWSVDDIARLWASEVVAESELTQLYTAALLANTGSQVVDLGKG